MAKIFFWCVKVQNVLDALDQVIQSAQMDVEMCCILQKVDPLGNDVSLCMHACEREGAPGLYWYFEM